VILRIALRAAAFVPLFVILGGLIGGVLVATAMVSSAAVGGRLAEYREPWGLWGGFAMVSVAGTGFGAAPAGLTALIAAVARSEFKRPAAYLATVTGVGLATSTALGVVLGSPGDTPPPQDLWVLGPAPLGVIGAVSAFVCAWLTRP